MTIKEATDILRRHNLWRRYDGPIGEGPEMPNPKAVGDAIDTIVGGLAELKSVIGRRIEGYKAQEENADSDGDIETAFFYQGARKALQSLLKHIEL